MDTTMEPDDLKLAWQSLDQQLQRNHRLDLALLRDRRTDQARRALRPLQLAQVLQFALGIGLLLLGLACWSRNTGVPGLFATGIAVHAFGVVTAVMAAITIALARSIDYAAPVLSIQRQLARLERFQRLNGVVCGAPWWIAWVLVVIAFAGLGNVPAGSGTPTWITISLALGALGTLATWAWMLWPRAPRTDARTGYAGDGCDGIRRGQQLVDEIARFERE